HLLALDGGVGPGLERLEAVERTERRRARPGIGLPRDDGTDQRPLRRGVVVELRAADPRGLPHLLSAGPRDAVRRDEVDRGVEDAGARGLPLRREAPLHGLGHGASLAFWVVQPRMPGRPRATGLRPGASPPRTRPRRTRAGPRTRPIPPGPSTR